MNLVRKIKKFFPLNRFIKTSTGRHWLVVEINRTGYIVAYAKDFNKIKSAQIQLAKHYKYLRSQERELNLIIEKLQIHNTYRVMQFGICHNHPSIDSLCNGMYNILIVDSEQNVHEEPSLYSRWGSWIIIVIILNLIRFISSSLGSH